MDVEIINTGSELLLGTTQNTHQRWLCQRLSEAGYRVIRQCCVADDGVALGNAIEGALERADIVITTGGLGPTSDDLTRDHVAGLLGLRLVEQADIVEHIQQKFKERGRRMPESCRVQAQVPEGAHVFDNAFGTAPGLDIGINRAGSLGRIIMLPGPPRELYPMFDNQVLPRLLSLLPPENPSVYYTWRTVGLGESMVAERIEGPLREAYGEAISIGYCCRPGEVDIRIGLPRDADVSRGVIDEQLRRYLGKLIFGEDEQSLVDAVVRMLAQRGETLALAESCTGGAVAHRITNIPGASTVFMGGVVSYSNQSKIQLLGVSGGTLEGHGAVSEPVVGEMAQGARRRFDADWALAVSGIAGPSGGTEEKPVGTVCLAVAGPSSETVVTRFNPFDRETFKWVTGQQLLDLLRLELMP